MLFNQRLNLSNKRNLGCLPLKITANSESLLKIRFVYRRPSKSWLSWSEWKIMFVISKWLLSDWQRLHLAVAGKVYYTLFCFCYTECSHSGERTSCKLAPFLKKKKKKWSWCRWTLCAEIEVFIAATLFIVWRCTSPCPAYTKCSALLLMLQMYCSAVITPAINSEMHLWYEAEKWRLLCLPGNRPLLCSCLVKGKGPQSSCCISEYLSLHWTHHPVFYMCSLMKRNKSVWPNCAVDYLSCARLET